MATSAAAAALPLPADAAPDSFNLVPALLSKPLNIPSKMRSSTIPVPECLRSDRVPGSLRWDLDPADLRGRPISTPKPGEPAGQLYNLGTDRQETTNVYASHPEVVRSLTEKLAYIGRGRQPSGGITV